MLKKSLLGIALVFSLSEAAMAAHAICVGGPLAPSYAFRDWNDASICRDRVASFGRDCRNMVRVAHCRTNWRSIDAVHPSQCVCNPGFHIGNWTN